MIFSILSTLYFHSFPRPEHVEADLDATLKDLQTDYVDSFVIHWPMACPSTGKNVTLRTNGIYPAHQSQSNHFHQSFLVNLELLSTFYLSVRYYVPYRRRGILLL